MTMDKIITIKAAITHFYYTGFRVEVNRLHGIDSVEVRMTGIPFFWW